MGTQVYDYTHVPTIRRFALSDARQRILQGPFGSGKSVGCVNEIVRRGHQQAPSTLDGIRKTRWAVIRNCYDDQTEVLTENRGWQLFRNLEPDDKVATLHPDTNTLEFDLPLEYYASPYKGDMIGVSNEGIDFLVTPDHGLWVSNVNRRKEEWGPYKLRPAYEIYGKGTYRFQCVADYHGTETSHSVDFFEFLGFWYAEGCANVYISKEGHERKHLVITQKAFVNYTDDLLHRVGLPYFKRDRGNGAFNFNIKVTKETIPLIRLLSTCGKELTKKLQPWMKNAPVSHLKAFIHGFIMGDGHYANGNHDATRCSTGSKDLANDLQEIALKAGYHTSMNHRRYTTPEGEERDIGVITFFVEKKHKPTAGKRHWRREPYDGIVYCLKVPSGLLFTRRNGKCSINSNTYSQLIDTTMKTFYDWFPPSKYGFEQVAKHNYIITGFDGVRIEVFFRAMDRPDQVDNLLSLELTGAWANELREIPKEIWEAVDGRIFRYPSKREGGPTWCGIIGDTNPPNEGSWLHELVEKTKPSNLEFFRQPGGRSPDAENLPNLPNGRAYYTDLAIGKSPEFINVYIDGNYGFTMKGVPVYQLTYSDSLHCAKQVIQPNKNLPLVTGWDFYLHPALILGQLTPRGQLIILDELNGDGMGIERFIEQMVEPLLYDKYRGMSVVGYGDPTGRVRSSTDETTCYDVLKKHNFHWVKECHTNAPLARIGAVEHYLTRLVDNGQPGFLLSPNCQMLREGFNGGYRRKDDGTIDKGPYSHGHDACQYLSLYTLWKHNRAAANALPTKRKRTNHLPASSAGY